jgi:hypothetical protein
VHTTVTHGIGVGTFSAEAVVDVSCDEVLRDHGVFWLQPKRKGLLDNSSFNDSIEDLDRKRATDNTQFHCFFQA